jgi:hypothetical protein
MFPGQLPECRDQSVLASFTIYTNAGIRIDGVQTQLQIAKQHRRRFLRRLPAVLATLDRQDEPCIE